MYTLYRKEFEKQHYANPDRSSGDVYPEEDNINEILVERYIETNKSCDNEDEKEFLIQDKDKNICRVTTEEIEGHHPDEPYDLHRNEPEGAYLREVYMETQGKIKPPQGLIKLLEEQGFTKLN
jgi:hypothetical protein